MTLTSVMLAGERQLELKGWQRGKINRLGLFISQHKNCLLSI